MQRTFNFNRSHAARLLPDLQEGDEVYIKDRKETGVVQEKVHDRSYQIATPSGKLRRNRVFLNKLPNTPEKTTDTTKQDTKVTDQSSDKPSTPVVDLPPTLVVTSSPAETVTRSGRVVKPSTRYTKDYQTT